MMRLWEQAMVQGPGLFMRVLPVHLPFFILRPMKPAASPKGLHVSIAKDYGTMSMWAADFIEEQLIEQRTLLLCASAGGSPTGCYEELGKRNQKTPGLFTKLRVLQIDEWGGLEPGHPATCRSYLETHLLRDRKSVV